MDASFEHHTSNGNSSTTSSLPSGGPAAMIAAPHDVAGTAHDWEDEKRRGKKFYDDGTMTFFWRAHRLTVLVLFSFALVYIAFFEPADGPTEANTKRGIIAMMLAFVLFLVTITPNGPFRRPHPAFWRLCFCLSIVYELALIFLLFQNKSDARKLLKHIDPKLGEEIPEKDFGGNCLIYDDSHPTDPFHNLWDKMDIFVAVHFFGWWVKTLVLRDWWLCMVISIMFEVLEYTLEHQLPNFSECWWDHWIMDALVCNGAGIYLGMKTLNFLNAKPYFWRGMWNIPTYRGKMTRILKQFTPYSWMDFDWRPSSSLKRWVAMLALIGAFLVAELNTFYMKSVLWIPPPHPLNMVRLALLLCWGAVSLRETFQFLDDPYCKKFGTQSWLMVAIILTELLIACKFEWGMVTKPLPPHISLLWLGIFASLAAWTLWHFYLQRLLWHTENKLKYLHGDDGQGALEGELHGQPQGQNGLDNNNIRSGKFPNQNGKAQNGKFQQEVDGENRGRRRQNRGGKRS